MAAESDASLGGCVMLPCVLVVLLAVAAFLVLAFRGMGFLAWLAASAIALVGWRLAGIAHPTLFVTCVVVLAMLALVFGLPPLRRVLISRCVMTAFAKVLPRRG